MDTRVRMFIEDTAQTLVGLSTVLFLQANPESFDTAAGIALRLRYEVEQVEPVLARLAHAAILRVDSRGGGRYQCYRLVRDRKVWDLLCRVAETYLDNSHECKEIVRMLMRQQTRTRATRPPGMRKANAKGD